MNTLHKKLNNINSKHNIIKTKLPLDTSTLDTPYISDKILSNIDWTSEFCWITSPIRVFL